MKSITAVQELVEEVTSKALQYINKTPALQSLLYDLDWMPEQLERGSRDWGSIRSSYGQF